MDTTAFSQARAAEGFDQFVRVEREPHGMLDTHSHAFEAKALVLAGDIRLRTADGAERTYRAGEVFHLEHGELHAEWYGPEGVTYLVARRSAAD